MMALERTFVWDFVLWKTRPEVSFVNLLMLRFSFTGKLLMSLKWISIGMIDGGFSIGCVWSLKWILRLPQVEITFHP